MCPEILLSEDAFIEELINLEHPIKPHHNPEPEESDYEFTPEFIFG